MELLEAKNVRKTYGGIAVLDGVSLQLKPGVMTGLVGENGAGKSTLIKIITGLVEPNRGEILVDGVRVDAKWDHVKAREAGISVIHQELQLVPHLTVAENIMLGGPEPAASSVRRAVRWIDRAINEERAREVLTTLGIHNLDVRTRVSSLGPGRAQVVLIARSLRNTGRVLVLDEPTAALAPEEREELFQLLRRLLKQKVAILFVSHHLQEVEDLCQEVLVLRNGKPTAFLDGSDISISNMIQAMLDRSLEDQFPSRDSVTSDEIVLDVDTFSRPGVFEEVSFRVRRGEILGIVGLLGAGKTELARAIVGADPSTGTREVTGTRVRFRHPKDGVKNGVSLVPEERKEQALFPALNVYENGIISKLITAYSSHGLRGILTRNVDMRRTFWNTVERLGVQFAGEKQSAAHLSGGNQQKLVIGRALACSPHVLVLDEPTRGVDVGSKREIYRIVAEEAGHGLAVIFVSSDTREVLEMSHRILVMRHGRIVAEVDPASTTNDELNSYIGESASDG